MNFVIYSIVLLAMSRLNCLSKLFENGNYLLLSNLYPVHFLLINQICKQKPAIHVSLICYCDDRIIQITAPFCCFASDHTHCITLIFLQQRVTVNGNVFLMTMVSNNPVTHRVATPTTLRGKQAAYKNRIQIL